MILRVLQFTARIILCTLVCIRHCTPDVASQTIECLSAYRLCYFTSASTNRKSDFVKELSASYKLACLTCLQGARRILPA